MAKNRGIKYVANPSATYRAMGEDLVVVNEDKGNLVVLNGTAKMILDGILENVTDATIARRMTQVFEFEEGARASAEQLTREIARTRDDLVRAGVLVTSRDFTRPEIKVRDLREALQNMDLTTSTVSQYE